LIWKEIKIHEGNPGTNPGNGSGGSRFAILKGISDEDHQADLENMPMLEDVIKDQEEN